jgi:hypothetical protein
VSLFSAPDDGADFAVDLGHSSAVKLCVQHRDLGLVRLDRPLVAIRSSSTLSLSHCSIWARIGGQSSACRFRDFERGNGLLGRRGRPAGIAAAICRGSREARS